MKQLSWTPWVKATEERLASIPASPGIYMFGLVFPSCVDVVYLGASSRADDSGGLRARLRDHLTGRSHVPELREAISRRAALLSYLPSAWALQAEWELIRLWRPAFNQTHCEHPRRLAGFSLQEALTREVPDGPLPPTYIPSTLRLLQREQLPDRYILKDMPLLSGATPEERSLLLRLAA